MRPATRLLPALAILLVPVAARGQDPPSSQPEARPTGLPFRFTLDQPASFAEGVTEEDLAFEIDWYLDWKINTNFTASLLAAYADPCKAVQQGFDRTKNFIYAMVYLGYSF
jgi:hypothetical protein